MWDNIHLTIRQSSQAIAETGKFDDAIFAAFRYIEAEIQERIGSSNIGKALLDEAFDGMTPKISISDNFRDRAGIKDIFSGALSNIRNDRGHKKTPILPCTTLYDCILYLSFASFLLYLLSKDKNTFPLIQTVHVFGSALQPRIRLRGHNFDDSARVLAENIEVTVVSIRDTAIEALLPTKFSGRVKVMVDGTESNEVNCDTYGLEQERENFYEIVATEIPLYKDASCMQLRVGIVGLLVRATEAGREVLRISPTYPSSYKAGHYISHGPFANEGIDETWYQDPTTGEIKYAWTSSLVTTPKIIEPAGTPQLVSISILPNVIKTQIEEKRTLRVIGIMKDGSIRKEIDLTDKVSWQPTDQNIAFVKSAVLFPKRLGKTRIECELKGFTSSSEVQIEHQPKGRKVVYFQGVRRLQEIRFDSQDNLYLCNQSASVYRIARTGGIDEIIRVSLPETSSYGIDCIAVDANRNLYTNEITQRVCLRFQWDGNKYTTPSIFANTFSGSKKSIAVDSTGNIFVAVMGANREGYIIQVESNGKETAFPTRDVPTCIALDNDGNILTPSGYENAVHVYNRDGSLINVISHGIKDSASDILVDKNGAIYLPFFYSGKLLKITLTASDTKTEWIADGFQAPGGIAMDSQGHIYVSNFSGNSIDMIY